MFAIQAGTRQFSGYRIASSGGQMPSRHSRRRPIRQIARKGQDRMNLFTKRRRRKKAASYSALRAGFVSECDRRHIPNGAVRAVTRHTSEAMLAVYDRPGELFSGSAGAYFEGV